jgi:hypothetical protein
MGRELVPNVPAHFRETLRAGGRALAVRRALELDLEADRLR